jgi:hypothetical protein
MMTAPLTTAAHDLADCRKMSPEAQQLFQAWKAAHGRLVQGVVVPTPNVGAITPNVGTLNVGTPIPNVIPITSAPSLQVRRAA